MASIIARSKRTWFESFCMNVIKCGDIPKHIGFIMDGNRRYARKLNKNVIEGHYSGFKQLTEILQWCGELGIKEITIYAFSTENFNRSKEEVDGLMELLETKFKEILDKKSDMAKHGLCLRIYGDTSLFSIQLQKLMAELVLETRNNDKAILNVCLAYTAQDEICNAIRQMGNGVSEGVLKPEDITEALLEQCLYTSKSFVLDMIVRTSGEVRLSNFLLWQSSFSVLSFTEVLWPAFSIWNLFASILFYQKNQSAVQKAKAKYVTQLTSSEEKSDYREALKEYLANNNNEAVSQLPQSFLANYKQKKMERCEKFLNNLSTREQKHLESLIKA